MHEARESVIVEGFRLIMYGLGAVTALLILLYA